MQVKILYQFCLRRIGKIYMLQIHFPICMFQILHILRLRYLRFFLYEREDTGGTGQRILQLCHNP